MATDPEGVVSFEAAGKKFSAVFGFKAMKAVEVHYGIPFFQAVQRTMPSIALEDTADAAKVAAAAASVRFTDLGVLLKFSLLKFHPDLTDEDIEDLIDEIGFGKVSEVIGGSLTAALVQEDDDSSQANPPKRRSAKTG